MPGLYNACMQSNVVEDRVSRPIHVSPDRVASETWRAVSNQKKQRLKYAAAPENWPRELNAILNGRFNYKAPIVTTTFNSMLAWRRRLKVGNVREPQWAECTATWPSRLLVDFDVVSLQSGPEFVVLHGGRWGILACKVQSLEAEEMWHVARGIDAVTLYYLNECQVSAEWPLVRPAHGVFHPEGLVLQGTEVPQLLVRNSCLRRKYIYIYIYIYIGRWETNRLLTMLAQGVGQ